MAVVDMSVWVDVLENASGQYIVPGSSVNLRFKVLPCVGSALYGISLLYQLAPLHFHSRIDLLIHMQSVHQVHLFYVSVLFCVWCGVLCLTEMDLVLVCCRSVFCLICNI